MPRSPKKKSPAACSSPKSGSLQKVRKQQSATENTRKTRNMFAIPPAAFTRVAKGILLHHGCELKVTKVSPAAVRALQRYTEANAVDLIDRARIVMTADGTEKHQKSTLMVKHLRAAIKAATVSAGVRTEIL